jgi:hypothetical protein
MDYTFPDLIIFGEEQGCAAGGLRVARTSLLLMFGNYLRPLLSAQKISVYTGVTRVSKY